MPASRHAELQAALQRQERELAGARTDLAGLVAEHTTLATLCKEALDSHKQAQHRIEQLKRDLAFAQARYEECQDDQPQIGGPVFQPLGIKFSVPLHLRACDPVRDRQMSPGELRVLVWDLMRERLAAAPLLGPAAPPLNAFVWERLSRQFAPEGCTEWAYNLQYGCERCTADPDLVLFSAILAGRTDEALWRQLVVIDERVATALECAAAETKNVVSAKTAAAAVKPVCTFVDVESLAKAAEAMLPKPGNPASLLRLPSVFLNELHTQYFRVNRQLLEVVVHRLRQAFGDADVSAMDLLNAIAAVSPSSTLEARARLLLWVFSPALLSMVDRQELCVAADSGNSVSLQKYRLPLADCVARVVCGCLAGC